MKQNIIAVDFDGTLCENKWPEIGMPNEELIEYLKKRQANGEKLILWTSRNEEQTKKAVEWCKKYGLIFDAVNDNLPEIVEAFGGNCRGVIVMVKVRDILPLIQWNDAQIIKDQDEEICLLRNDFMVGSLSEEILNMTVTGIENDENIENTVVVYVTDEED